MTVDPQSAAYDPRPLKEYLATLGVSYFYEEQGMMFSVEISVTGSPRISFVAITTKYNSCLICANRC